MKPGILFMMDDANYKGGAHFTPYARKVTADDKKIYAGFNKIIFASNYVKNADLFALFSHYEVGTPLAVYESLLVGTPVISTCYMTNESYTPAETGFFVENNETAVYNGLKNLLDNKTLVDTARYHLNDYTYDISECEKRILNVFMHIDDKTERDADE